MHRFISLPIKKINICKSNETQYKENWQITKRYSKIMLITLLLYLYNYLLVPEFDNIVFYRYN